MELVRIGRVGHGLVDGDRALHDVELPLHLRISKVGEPGGGRLRMLRPGRPHERVHDHQEDFLRLLGEARRVPVHAFLVSGLDQQPRGEVADHHHPHLPFSHRTGDVTPRLGAVELVQVRDQILELLQRGADFRRGLHAELAGIELLVDVGPSGREQRDVKEEDRRPLLARADGDRRDVGLAGFDALGGGDHLVHGRRRRQLELVEQLGVVEEPVGTVRVHRNPVVLPLERGHLPDDGRIVGIQLLRSPHVIHRRDIVAVDVLLQLRPA